MQTPYFSRIRRLVAVLLTASILFAPAAQAQTIATASVPTSDTAFQSIFSGGPVSTEELLTRHVTLGEAMVSQWAKDQQTDILSYADANKALVASLIGDEAAALDMSSNLFLTPQAALNEVKANGFNLTELSSVADLYTQFEVIADSVDGQVATTAAEVATAYGTSWTSDIDFTFTPPEALSFGLLYDTAIAQLVANHGTVLTQAQQNTGGPAYVDAFNAAFLEAAQQTSVGMSDLNSPCLAAFNYATATGVSPTDPGLVTGGCAPCVSAGTYMHQKLKGVMNPAMYDYGSGDPGEAIQDSLLTQNELDNLDNSFLSAALAYSAQQNVEAEGLDEFWAGESFYASVNAGNCAASTAGVSGAVTETLPDLIESLDLFTELPEDEGIEAGSLLDTFFPSDASDEESVIDSFFPDDTTDNSSLLDTFFPDTESSEEDESFIDQFFPSEGEGFSSLDN